MNLNLKPSATNAKLPSPNHVYCRKTIKMLNIAYIWNFKMLVSNLVITMTKFTACYNNHEFHCVDETHKKSSNEQQEEEDKLIPQRRDYNKVFFSYCWWNALQTIAN